jgi:acyl-CoA thioester hydrolase
MEEYLNQVRVRYSEIDRIGVVYHANYIPYFEMGRVEWLEKKGISIKDMEANGVGLPVISLTVNYKRPSYYNDLLTVKTRLKKYSFAKIEFECEIWNEQNELVTDGHFTLVFVNQFGKATVPPDNIVKILNGCN